MLGLAMARCPSLLDGHPASATSDIRNATAQGRSFVNVRAIISPISQANHVGPFHPMSGFARSLRGDHKG
jgi:hypothetical protein